MPIGGDAHRYRELVNLYGCGIGARSLRSSRPAEIARGQAKAVVYVMDEDLAPVQTLRQRDGAFYKRDAGKSKGCRNRL